MGLPTFDDIRFCHRHRLVLAFELESEHHTGEAVGMGHRIRMVRGSADHVYGILDVI